MKKKSPPQDRNASEITVQARLEYLESRLAESEETLHAIRNGTVDALVVKAPKGDQVYTLSGAERPYRIMIEMLNEGAAILVRNGRIFYSNQRLADMIGIPLEKMIGSSIYRFIGPQQKSVFKTVIRQGLKGSGRYETTLQSADGHLVPVLLSVSHLEDIDAPGSICLIATDISESKRSQESLKKSEKELRIKSDSLEEVNSALRLLLKRVEEGQISQEEKILANIRELVLPYLDRLKKTSLSEYQASCLAIAETNLDNIASSFLYHLKMKYLSLTHREIQVATLVKEGKSVKEIARILSVTDKTVEFHRNSLRSKLGLKNKKANLRSHLLTFV